MTTPRDHDRDDDFDATLRERQRFVPRFDDVDDAEPSPELDRLVLARAREALRPAAAAAAARAPAPRGAPGSRFRGPRWAVPLAVAATVLVSFTLVMQLDPARNDTVLAPRDVAPPSAPGASGEALDASPLAAVESTGGARGAPPPNMEATAAPPAMPAPPAAPPPPPPPAPVSATADQAAAVSAQRAAARPPAAREPSAYATEDASRTEAVAAKVARSRNPPGAAADTTDADASASAPAAPAALAAAAPAPADDEADPATWLARIEALQLAGKLDAARAELAEFRRIHPDVPLPPALRELR